MNDKRTVDEKNISIDRPKEERVVGHLSRNFKRFLTEVVYHSATIQTLD